MSNRKLLLFLFTIFSILACKKEKEPDHPAVVVASVEREDVKLFGEYVGRIRAYRYVEVRARVEGYLNQMMFEEGKRVEQGEVLFLIDPSQYKARMDKAEAQLKRDIASFNKAKRDLERLRPLYEQNAASRLDLDNAIAAYESAEANVAMSKADLAQYKLEYDFTTVRSPLHGYISERYVDIGALVGPGNNSLLATVVQSDTVLVDFKMTALDYLRSRERNVNIGQTDSTRSWQPTVRVTLADNSEYPLEGVVDFADPQVDPKTGTFGVRAELANPNQVLLPGQFTKVNFLLDVLEGAVVVPRKSLIIEKGGSFVYVMRRDSVAEKRFVETGPEIDNNVVIERGLGYNEKIIIEGQQKINPGIKVNPVAPSSNDSTNEDKK
ncbi:efflux RND transporter periplasmic adaptor subunit [Carboxylicivirga mesophila]|uniref:Efflux RND transporter periplasmic adaptor subunit n=1 Tax=Carboxylicivirga mesophila TaxID=1166478 RepID=A0ABS5KE72_9BACT|nr:efflux RND transporter periplasmic adaptor subunit [Carboxylicivirga mesophila]MBS2213305.1 efflux RND transporter periplasmic adaptor subunit [Carboxylicivirga mesophila]